MEKDNYYDNIDIHNMTKEQIKELVKAAIKNHYVLNKNSLDRYKFNKRIVINTINLAYDNIKYIPEKMLLDKDIFNLLISKGYVYKPDILRNISLDSFRDSDILLKIFDYDYVFSQIQDYNHKQSLAHIYFQSINNKPTIKSLSPYIDYISELNWKEYKKENINEFSNVFLTIINHIRKCQNKYEIYNLNILTNIKNKLNNKHELLVNTMDRYYEIYNSNDLNKQNKIVELNSIISDISSLYIAKCKEEYKKQIREKFNEWLKIFFIPKKDTPIIKHRVIEHRQADKMKELYQNEEPCIKQFINDLVLKYKEIDTSLVLDFINQFIINRYSSIQSFIEIPDGLYDYEKYHKAKKIINRLNKNYIDINDLSFKKYQDVIAYNGNNYYYSGVIFNKKEINILEEYLSKEYLYKKIRRDISLKTKELKVSHHISKKILNILSNEIPFNDIYYEFDIKLLKKIKFKSLCDYCLIENRTVDYLNENKSSINYLSFLKQLFINNNLIWLMLMEIYDNKKYNSLFNEQLDYKYLAKNIDYIPDIMEHFKKINWSLNSINNFLLAIDLIGNCDANTSAILGEDIIGVLSKECRNEPYAEKHLKMARDLVIQMSYRHLSTVPFIEGDYMEYHYNMYDHQDESLLLSGINTNSCFAIDDTDNDFLHYCALNKNGFVIKITDYNNNFIGRASGFRQGNCVFINQLRTIYDRGGYFKGTDEYIRNNIVETFKKACCDIISTSQNNPNEQEKIDYVLVTQSYCLSNYPSNVSNEVEEYIENDPINHASNDWKNFVDTTLGLTWIGNYQDVMETDYGNYKLICMASSKNHLTVNDIRTNEVWPNYERKRNEIITGSKDNPDIMKKINKIYGIYCCNNSQEFNNINIPDEALITVGDNWFIVYTNNHIITSCVLDYDQKALIEYQNMIKQIKINKQLKKKLC